MDISLGLIQPSHSNEVIEELDHIIETSEALWEETSDLFERLKHPLLNLVSRTYKFAKMLFDTLENYISSESTKRIFSSVVDRLADFDLVSSTIRTLTAVYNLKKNAEKFVQSCKNWVTSIQSRREQKIVDQTFDLFSSLRAINGAPHSVARLLSFLEVSFSGIPALEVVKPVTTVLSDIAIAFAGISLLSEMNNHYKTNKFIDKLQRARYLGFLETVHCLSHQRQDICEHVGSIHDLRKKSVIELKSLSKEVKIALGKPVKKGLGERFVNWIRSFGEEPEAVELNTPTINESDRKLLAKLKIAGNRSYIKRMQEKIKKNPDHLKHFQMRFKEKKPKLQDDMVIELQDLDSNGKAIPKNKYPKGNFFEKLSRDYVQNDPIRLQKAVKNMKTRLGNKQFMNEFTLGTNFLTVTGNAMGMAIAQGILASTIAPVSITLLFLMLTGTVGKIIAEEMDKSDFKKAMKSLTKNVEK